MISFINIRRILIFVCIVFVFSSMLARLVYLQGFKPEKYDVSDSPSRGISEFIRAKRGDILDRNLRVVASTYTVADIGVDAAAIKPVDFKKTKEIAKILGINETFVIDAFNAKSKNSKPKRWVKIASDVNESVLEKINALNIKGLYGNRKYKRNYPNNTLASHIIGYTNKENSNAKINMNANELKAFEQNQVFSEGIEKTYDFYLSGHYGFKEKQIDAKRNEIVFKRGNQTSATNGWNVVLTLDMVIQDFVEQEIKKIVEKANPKGVTILVSEPSTGDILALGNYPTFDPNDYGKYTQLQKKNRAVTDPIEPGSTMKIVTLCAGIEEKLVTSNTIYDCSVSTANVNGRTVRLPSDTHRYEKLTVREFFEKSSNRGFAQMGVLLGEKKLTKYFKNFGYASLSKSGFLGESRGILNPIKNGDNITITRLPCGYGMSATALQIHNATSTIANSGILMQPKIVKCLLDENLEPAMEIASTPVRRAISPKTAQIVTDIMVGVTKKTGTGRSAAIEGFDVAGKTGTARKISNGKYLLNRHVGTFTGFFPAEQPKIVITVIVDEAQSLGRLNYGGTLSGPAFKNIGTKIIKHLGIKPDSFTQQTIALKGLKSDRIY